MLECICLTPYDRKVSQAQTKPKQTRFNRTKANETNTTHGSQILHTLPLWHRGAKKAERTPTTQAGSGVSPMSLDTEPDGIMSNPIRGLKVILRVELLPSC